MDDPSEQEETAWCAEQRQQVITHMHEEGIAAPRIGERPDWHIAPIISVWAMQDGQDAANRWWAVSGDFPTDHIIRAADSSPRQALHDIGVRWRDGAERWAKGESTDGWGLRNEKNEKELAPLLATRAELFLEIAADDANWPDLSSA